VEEKNVDLTNKLVVLKIISTIRQKILNSYKKGLKQQNRV
jgi:hypothetical protein